MSFFTNPFAPHSPVPVFASSPLNPLPTASFPLPANRRTSLVRAAPGPSTPPASSPSPSDSSLGAAGGITFVSPFASPSSSPAPNHSRRNSATGSAGTTKARGSSHSRVGAGPPGGHEYAQPSPGSRRGSNPNLATTHAHRSPPAAPATLPFFANLTGGGQTPPALAVPSAGFFTQPVDFSRRRSVDVGVLGLGTHRQNGIGSMSKRVREAVGPDAGDKESGFVGSNGLKSGKDRL